MTKKKIIVVDDEPLIPVLMKEIIEEDPELEVSQIANRKDDFLQYVERDDFDAAVIDISLGGPEGGMELLQAMKHKAKDMPLIILSAHDEFLYGLKSLQAGARGYINKKYICTHIVACLKEVLGGNYFVSGDKGEQILSHFKKLNVPANVDPR
jgi:DNA-binding NarL/FixJ family response regulator